MTTNFASNRAKDFAVRLNNLLNEQKKTSEDIKELKAEAAGEGYDKKALTKAVRLLRQDPKKRQEEEAQLDLWLTACEGVDFTA